MYVEILDLISTFQNNWSWNPVNREVNVFFFEVGNVLSRKDSQNHNKDSSCSGNDNSNDGVGNGELIDEEEVVGGRSKLSVYKFYIQTISDSPKR